MKLYRVDKDYFDYVFKNVDKEVLFGHSGEKGRGRANVLVKRMEYNGQYLDFAIPEKGDISFAERDDDVVRLSVGKKEGKYTSGFVVNKLMPIDSSLLVPFNFEANSQFRDIATEITRKEPELILKSKNHLRKLEDGTSASKSTNVDKQLEFLNARTELLNQGYREEDIYRESFKTNLIKAKMLKKQALENVQATAKSLKEINLEL